MVFLLFVVSFFTLAFILYNTFRQFFPKKHACLPPGPKGIPFLGNIMDLPPKGKPEFQHFLRHKDLYGPVSSIRILDKTVIFLNNAESARNVLEKMSMKTSGRPLSVFAYKLCGLKDVVLKQYDTELRCRRWLMNRQIGSKSSVSRFHDIFYGEMRRFLLGLLEEPQDLHGHISNLTRGIAFKSLYGYSIAKDKQDPLLQLLHRSVQIVNQATVPMAWLVDVFPVMQYLPGILPGMGFKKTAKTWKKVVEAMPEVPFQFSVRQIAANEHKPSIVSHLLEHDAENRQALSEEYQGLADIKFTASSLLTGATESIEITFMSFLAAMIQYPEVQRKAQDEIDLRVGADRLPNLSDRPQLPYVDAILKEVYRWWPVVPLGFPHAASETFEYNGYIIPKGAILVPAVWSILHNEEVYKDAIEFNPQRFLKPRLEPDPRPAAFGYGRRACPGQNFADSELFLIFAQTLAGFHLAAPINKNGQEEKVKIEVPAGMLAFVQRFPYKIVPRSSKHIDLVRGQKKVPTGNDDDSNLINISFLEQFPII